MKLKRLITTFSTDHLFCKPETTKSIWHYCLLNGLNNISRLKTDHQPEKKLSLKKNKPKQSIPTRTLVNTPSILTPHNHSLPGDRSCFSSVSTGSELQTILCTRSQGYKTNRGLHVDLCVCARVCVCVYVCVAEACSVAYG